MSGGKSVMTPFSAICNANSMKNMVYAESCMLEEQVQQ